MALRDSLLATTEPSVPRGASERATGHSDGLGYAMDSLGMTALMHAAEQGHMATVSAILSDLPPTTIGLTH